MSNLEVTSFISDFAMFGSDIEAKSNMNDVIPSCTSKVRFKLSTDLTTWERVEMFESSRESLDAL
jgi:hypothetical protein